MTIGVRCSVLAAVLMFTAGPGSALAQTVIVRKVPGGTTVALQVSGKDAGSTKADADGIATLPLDLQKLTGKAQIDAGVQVDVCGALTRVVIVERGALAPPPEAGCERRGVSGLFLVRGVTTLVIDTDRPSPSLLLIQGSYDPRATRSTRAGPLAPSGLVVFGGGGSASYRDAKDIACGDAASCDGDGPWGAVSAGVTYWITPFVGAELSYLKPQVLNVEGRGTGFQFENNLEAHVLAISGKAGIPAGIVRIYGQGGWTYTQASFRTIQTADNVTGSQAFEVETTGWGWHFGGGLEAWMSRRFGLYGEFGFASVKGKAEEEEGGEIDDRVTSIIIGLRFAIGG